MGGSGFDGWRKVRVIEPIVQTKREKDDPAAKLRNKIQTAPDGELRLTKEERNLFEDQRNLILGGINRPIKVRGDTLLIGQAAVVVIPMWQNYPMRTRVLEKNTEKGEGR